MSTNTNQNNVTPITAGQIAPAARFAITATLDGFPIQVEVEGKAGDLRSLVDRLKAIGATPPAAVQTSAPPEPAQAPAPQSCPHHPGRKLKASTVRAGQFFCTAKDDSG